MWLVKFKCCTAQRKATFLKATDLIQSAPSVVFEGCTNDLNYLINLSRDLELISLRFHLTQVL